MPAIWQPPAFSIEPWYSDPKDHRCPQDATLESVETGKPAIAAATKPPYISIVLKLLNARRNGMMVFSYSAVRSHSLACYQCDQGAGIWLRDEFSRSEAGLTEHRIVWHSAMGEKTQWFIEAEKIEFRSLTDSFHSKDSWLG